MHKRRHSRQELPSVSGADERIFELVLLVTGLSLGAMVVGMILAIG